jgi:hypothetical protein
VKGTNTLVETERVVFARCTAYAEARKAPAGQVDSVLCQQFMVDFAVRFERCD